MMQAGDATIDVAAGKTLSLDAKSSITGSLTVSGNGDFRVDNALQVGSLDVTAHSTVVSADITTTSDPGGIDFEGPVQFSPGTGGLAIATAGKTGVTFGDDVQVNGPLTIATGTGTGTVGLKEGTWTQGAGILTVDGSLEIGTATNANAPAAPPTLVLEPGSQVDLTGKSTDTFTVQPDGTLNVAGGAATISNGALPVSLVADARLGIQFAAGAVLNITGTGPVSIAGALLIGTGLAPAQNTTILSTPNASITGAFAGSVDNSNTPTAFLAESDIVVLSYGGSTVGVAEGGTVAQGERQAARSPTATAIPSRIPSASRRNWSSSQARTATSSTWSCATTAAASPGRVRSRSSRRAARCPSTSAALSSPATPTWRSTRRTQRSPATCSSTQTSPPPGR
jgi:hypothetical protein